MDGMGNSRIKWRIIRLSHGHPPICAVSFPSAHRT
jgi:hypothetical protein